MRAGLHVPLYSPFVWEMPCGGTTLPSMDPLPSSWARYSSRLRIPRPPVVRVAGVLLGDGRRALSNTAASHRDGHDRWPRHGTVGGTAPAVDQILVTVLNLDVAPGVLRRAWHCLLYGGGRRLPSNG